MTGMVPLPFSLGRRLLLCMAMLALESFVSYEELFMLPMLQRVGVPTARLPLLSRLPCLVAIFTSSSPSWAGPETGSRAARAVVDKNDRTPS